jgi:hypothetical protein
MDDLVRNALAGAAEQVSVGNWTAGKWDGLLESSASGRLAPSPQYFPFYGCRQRMVRG